MLIIASTPNETTRLELHSDNAMIYGAKAVVDAFFEHYYRIEIGHVRVVEA